jgi:Zn-dependent protease
VGIRAREALDMAVSLLALSLGFAVAMSGRGLLGGINWARALSYLPAVFVTLLFAFVLHELAHRQVARRFGHYAFYQADYLFLALSLLIPLLFGFVFAAPGAVIVIPRGHFWREDLRRDVFFISVAGPLTNLALAAAGIALLYRVHSPWLELFTYINAWLAVFNLLPLGPLDGRKALEADFRLWLAVFAAAAALLAYIFLGRG